jgi:ribosomal protein S18 acetylase RimI-like enzyme
MLAEETAWFGAPEVTGEEAGALLDDHGPGVIFERADRVAGYASVDEGGGSLVLADPEDPAPALEALVAWLDAHGHHEVETYAGDTERISWLQTHGFTYLRSSFDLQRGIDVPLAPAAWPDGVTIAPYRRGDDDAAVHALIYVDAAWGEVPGHTQRSLAAWRAMMTPEQRGWIARGGDQPLGWVVGRVFDDGRGWIQQLAVARSARRRGLGRALLLHSLADLRPAGATSYALGVQADNEHAVQLYRDIGFEVTHEWRVYDTGAA